MKPKCILIVDDDQNIREMLDQFLGQYHQCMTRPVSDPEAALAQLRRLPFNLVLTDINHPGMDGLTLTRQVRRRNGPPVIALTGCTYCPFRDEIFSLRSRRAEILTAEIYGHILRIEIFAQRRNRRK